MTDEAYSSQNKRAPKVRTKSDRIGIAIIIIAGIFLVILLAALPCNGQQYVVSTHTQFEGDIVDVRRAVNKYRTFFVFDKSASQECYEYDGREVCDPVVSWFSGRTRIGQAAESVQILLTQVSGDHGTYSTVTIIARTSNPERVRYHKRVFNYVESFRR